MYSEVYLHYKNEHFYEIVHDRAKIEATEQECVVYRCVDSGQVWVRPRKEFFETVEHYGHTVPRFQKYVKATYETI